MSVRLPSWATGSAARLALGLGGSSAFLVLFLRNADFHQVGRAFTDVSAWWIGPALLVYFAGIAARAWRWHWLLLHIKSIPWWRLFPIVAIGFGVNNVLPLRAGELVRAHVLYQRHDISRLSGLSSIFMTRVYDGLMLTFFLVIGVIASLVGFGGMNDAGDELTAAMAFLVFGITGAFLVFGAIARRPADAERIVGRVLSRLPGQAGREWTWLQPLITGMSAQANRQQVIGALIASLIAWALEALMYWMVGQAFNLGLPFPVYLLVAAAANLLIHRALNRGRSRSVRVGDQGDPPDLAADAGDAGRAGRGIDRRRLRGDSARAGHHSDLPGRPDHPVDLPGLASTPISTHRVLA